MILLYIAGLIISFYLLAILTEEYFVESLEKISEKMKLNAEMTGATFMAIGSSAPEFFTSLLAIFRIGESANLGASTIVGSAIFNILVIIGASSLFAAAKLTWQPVIRDLMYYSISIVMLLFVFWDGKVSQVEALGFVVGYLIYIGIVSQWRKWFKYEIIDLIDVVEDSFEKNVFARNTSKIFSYIIPNPKKGKYNYIWTFLISIILIALLSHVLVESAAHIGEILNIPATILGLTVLAAGTSIPDLLSSVIVAKKGKGDMAVSNAVGSNIFDILFGLGVPWSIYFLINSSEKSIAVDNDNLLSSIFLLFATVLVVLTILVLRRWRIGKYAGILLLATYGMYLVYVVYLALS